MIGRIIGGLLGRSIGRQHGNHPIAGSIIGAGTLMAARRLFPQRYALLAATVAAGYLTKKWAERAEQRREAEAAHAADPSIRQSDVVDTYAGTDHILSDGEQIGDALPPAIPIGTNGKRPAIH
ncbi:hypothetical protein JI743_10280 [Sphingopyxis sp. DHUNG17]|jgi:hypothetical protein|uniref:hypothetical protein n=1 Tax=Sphingopyxis jiangsuensis TaxID=2871171 RepID=UPI00191E5385|nr:hypothetical protein [Sphingopyxis lutea]MBL0769195.1 hypothetical protein [Sphingopyxis lutea]